jgi:hypothetical protein
VRHNPPFYENDFFDGVAGVLNEAPKLTVLGVPPIYLLSFLYRVTQPFESISFTKMSHNWKTVFVSHFGMIGQHKSRYVRDVYLYNSVQA